MVLRFLDTFIFKSAFVRLSVHPKLAVTLFLDFDPVIDAVGGEDEGGLLRVAVTHF